MLNVGIIGAGTISQYHIQAFCKNANCNVVAIADINKALAEKRAKDNGIEKAYGDYREILNDKSIDAVSIVTPTFTHKNIIVEALRSGKDVL